MPAMDLDACRTSVLSVNPSGATVARTVGRRAVTGWLNVFLIGVALAGTLFQLFGLPLALRGFGWHAAWLLLPIMLLQPLHWGLIHESIHCHLLRSRVADALCARVLSISVGVPFDATRFSHLVHHRFSRHGYDRADVFNGRGSYLLAWMRYWGRLFGGVYLGILSSPLIACIPTSLGVRLFHRLIPIHEQGDALVRRLFTSLVRDVPKRRRMRRDFAMTLLLYAVSAWTYGAWWPMLLASMYVRGLWHSLADNVSHHDVSLEEPLRARDYTLPRFWRLLLLNQHLHLTHHRYPNVPWARLGSLSLRDDAQRNGSYFRAALRQMSLVYPRIEHVPGPADASEAAAAAT